MNPIEKLRQQREAVWDRERLKEAKKAKPDLASAEEAFLAERKAARVEEERKSGGVALGVIQRDVVTFLREAHRAVGLDEIGKRVRFDVAGSAELLGSLENHPRVKIVGKGLFAYRPRYEVKNIAEMEQLLEKTDEGIIATELKESYHEAEADIETLKRSGRVLVIPNKQEGSDILFPCYEKFDIPMPPTLKEAWHQVHIPDAAKLVADLRKLGLPVAQSGGTSKSFRKSQKKKKVQKKSGRSVKDQYNDHVPDSYKSDAWKETLSDTAQIYGKH